MEWGCYCPRHLEAFGRIAGACVTREELVQAILRPGSPHPWRTPWLNLLQGTLADVARMLAGAVHEVSPETEIGWMTTNAEMMAIEGRDPRVQIDALVHPENPQPRAAIRITMGGYAEGNLRQFLSQDLALKKVLGCLPAATLRCTEIEGCPNSSYAKSAAWYRAEMAWACVLGAPHQTLNVYDYYGGAMADSPEVGRMLRASRPALDAVAQAAAGAAHRGVRLFHPPHSAREVHTQDGSDMWETKLSATGWANPLRAIGVPVCFEGEQEVAAVTGQVFRCLGREEILALFRRGVLLDLSALRVLQELGLGHLAGATLVEEMEAGTRVYGVEEVTDPEYGGGEHTYLWWNSFSAPTIGRLEPAPTARVISALRGPDPGLELPGMTLFENELGGRVAVTPQDYSGTLRSGPGPSIFYYLPRRKRMMQPLARWLAQDRLPLEVDAPGWVLPHRADRDGRILVGVMNVNLDPWRGIAMSLTAGGPVRSVTKLDKNGTWADVPDGTWDQQGTQVTVRLRARVDPLQVVSLLLRIG